MVITILWEAYLREERDLVERVAHMHDADLVKVPRNALPHLVLPALARGAVVAIVDGDLGASRALGLGIDEVVRSGHLTADVLNGAINRAGTRAEARVLRETYARTTTGDDDGLALRLLARAISHEVNNPLQALVLDTESLARGLYGVLDANKNLVKLAGPVLSAREKQTLALGMGELLDPNEFEDILDNMRECLQRAAHAMRRLGTLTYDPPGGGVQAAKVVRAIADTLGPDFEAEIVLELKSDAPVEVPRATLVCVVGALIAHALEAMQVSKAVKKHKLKLRVTDEDGAVLIEVQHSGISLPADLRPNVFEPYFRSSQKALPAAGLQGIRERARRWGGELLVMTEKDSTTFRLILPDAKETLSSGRGDPIPQEESAPRLRVDDFDD